MQRLSPVVLNLLILNVLVYLASILIFRPDSKLGYVYEDFFVLHKSNALGIHQEVEYQGSPWYVARQSSEEKIYVVDEADQFRPLQIVTSFFSHSQSSFLHILFNMLALVMFGPMIEGVMGSKRFLQFYLFCGVLSGIMLAFLDPSPNPVVGASTAISGVLIAFGAYFPEASLLLFFFLPVKARMAAFIWGAIAAGGVLMELSGRDAGNWSHFGHMAGIISALIFLYLKRYLKFLN